MYTSNEASNEAQLVEHRTGIAEVMGSNPVEASELRTAFNSCFISARIIFTSNLDTFN